MKNYHFEVTELLTKAAVLKDQCVTFWEFFFLAEMEYNIN